MAFSASQILAMTRTDFRQEAEELLTELDTVLLQLEAAPTDSDSINRAFRAMHTLKGSGATAGFTEVSAVVHHIEDTFIHARDGRLRITGAMIDVILKVLDVVRRLLSAEPSENAALLAEGMSIVASLVELVPATSGDQPPAPPVAKAAAEPSTTKRKDQLWRIRFAPEPRVFFTGNEPTKILRELLSLGHGTVKAETSGLLEEPTFDPELCYLAWEIQLATEASLESLRDVFSFVDMVATITIEPAPETEEAWVLPAGAYFDATTVKEFHDEAEEDIAEVEKHVLALEQESTSPEHLVGLKRALHNLKGVCRLLLSDARRLVPARHPLRAMSDLTHAAEGFLEVQGKAGEVFGPRSSELLLLTVDGLKTLVHCFLEGEEVWPTELLDRLGNGEGFIDDPLPSVAYAPLQPREEQREPKAMSLRPSKLVAPRQRASKPSGPQGNGAATATATAPQRSVRVEQAKLDRLMSAIGELLVAKNALPVLATRAHESRGALGKDIKETGDRIARIADDLQDAMRQIRMMPIRSVFQRFPRMIRDLARSEGKEVHVVITGDETELDKTVLEQIGDPLVHLVRNAVDHGVELPLDRLARGKAETATVKLEVTTEGRHVVIRVSDDGRGMDPSRLRSKAVEKGLLSESDAAALDDKRALELIFLPGFSTAATVTAISGRGVGMDVVLSNIRDLRGTITLASELGSGSVMTIRLPSSMMVSKGILVGCGDEQYVLPIEGIREMVKLRREHVFQFGEVTMSSIRGATYPVFSLARLLGLANRAENEGSPFGADEVNAAIITTRRGDIAVVVDRLVAEIDVIVKPLTDGLDKLTVFRGATILGDGSVALIVDPGQLDALVEFGGDAALAA